MHLLVALVGEIADDQAPPPANHDWLIATLGGVLVTAIVAPLIMRWLDRRQRREVREVHAHLVNSHGNTIYRDQFDKVLEVVPLIPEIVHTLHRLDDDLGGIRSELRTERAEARRNTDRTEKLEEKVDGLAALHRREHVVVVRRLDAIAADTAPETDIAPEA